MQVRVHVLFHHEKELVSFCLTRRRGRNAKAIFLQVNLVFLENEAERGVGFSRDYRIENQYSKLMF